MKLAYPNVAGYVTPTRVTLLRTPVFMYWDVRFDVTGTPVHRPLGVRSPLRARAYIKSHVPIHEASIPQRGGVCHPNAGDTAADPCFHVLGREI